MKNRQDVDKGEIKDYWETRLPQTWYSDKTPGSREWFNEIEYERYHTFYELVPRIAEFEHHGGERVLEVGVGIGTDLAQYARNGARVSGIDLTEEAVNMTRENFEQRGLEYETLQTADAENLPFEDNSFDLVFSNGVLHHTPNTDKAVQEIHRVLKPHGKTIVLLYARGIKHYLKRIGIQGVLKGGLLRQGYNRLISSQTEVHGGSPLTYVFTRGQVKDLFKGFGDIDIKKYRFGEYFDYAPYRSRKVPEGITNVMYLLGLDRLIGEDFIIKAKKGESRPRLPLFRTLLKP
jgi:SAM-dependent methyltransferase